MRKRIKEGDVKKTENEDEVTRNRNGVKIYRKVSLKSIGTPRLKKWTSFGHSSQTLITGVVNN